MVSWPWSKKPVEPPSVDRVWASLQARDQALVRAAQTGPVQIIAFFEDTVTRVEAAMKARGCEGSIVRRVDRLEPLIAGRAIYLAERHPLPAHNRALLERLQREAPTVTPICFSALDEPLMKLFGGDRLAQLMSTLGMKEDEPIEHPMVSKALANAREKIEKKVGSLHSLAGANSMQEWMSANVPAK